ncbi:alpha/beta hydrolase [Peribacillus frigoritolerans]|nr:alpha/beta hydrolase [Peribacillus frigoritolerans]
MIIIAGSGPTDKDGNTIGNPGKNNSLKMLAESLAEKGIASIRYDKRGIGENMQLTGKEEDLRFEQYIDDAAAWVKFAKKDGRFSKVGIIGHSEGSLIGMAAAKKTETDIFISLAGAGEPIDQVLIKQLEEQLTPSLLTETKDILAKLKQGKQVETVSADLQSVFRPSVQPYMIS